MRVGRGVGVRWRGRATAPGGLALPVLAGHGQPGGGTLPYAPLTDAEQTTGLLAPRLVPVCYKKAGPGELVRMDLKKLGRIPDGGDRSAYRRGTGYGPAIAWSAVRWACQRVRPSWVRDIQVRGRLPTYPLRMATIPSSSS